MKSDRTYVPGLLGSVLLAIQAVIAGGALGGCDRVSSLAGLEQLQVTLKVSEGVLFSHDFILTNTSGKSLSEVHMSIQVFGENAAPVLERYWASWPLGGEQTFSVPVDQVKNLQRVALRGRADQGRFDLTWTQAD